MDEKTLLQLGQGDIDPLLVILRGGAVDTPGGGSGGGRGGPASSVREEQHHRHKGLLVICRTRAGLPKSGQEDVNQPLVGRQGVAALTSGRGSGGGRAQTRSQQYRSTADPRGQGRGAAMPWSITGLGSRGHQAVSHGPLTAWRSHGGGHDCGPPVCGAFQLGAGCRCNTLGLLHSVRPGSCGTVMAATLTVPRCISNHVVTVARDVPHAEVEASQSASRSTMAT
ncbi:hypothetical protein TcYC6_0039930 [Trypanosoma cruzi]|nr:hypothetical protein TcYC6_0039930 [Trypanosoma cruzi]